SNRLASPAIRGLLTSGESRGVLSPVDSWCPWRGLNARPLPYQGSALPLSYMGASSRLARISFRSCPAKFFDVTGAGEGNRTLVVSLEGFCSTIELHPRALPASPPHLPSLSLRSQVSGTGESTILRGLAIDCSLHPFPCCSCGGGGRIRTFEGRAGRFTVCSL